MNGESCLCYFFFGYEGDDYPYTTDGFTMPIGGHKDNELIKNLIILDGNLQFVRQLFYKLVFFFLINLNKL